jgi:hypothetical protein
MRFLPKRLRCWLLNCKRRSILQQERELATERLIVLSGLYLRECSTKVPDVALCHSYRQAMTGQLDVIIKIDKELAFMDGLWRDKYEELAERPK